MSDSPTGRIVSLNAALDYHRLNALRQAQALCNRSDRVLSLRHIFDTEGTRIKLRAARELPALDYAALEMRMLAALTQDGPTVVVDSLPEGE